MKQEAFRVLVIFAGWCTSLRGSLRGGWSRKVLRNGLLQFLNSAELDVVSATAASAAEHKKNERPVYAMSHAT